MTDNKWINHLQQWEKFLKNMIELMRADPSVYKLQRQLNAIECVKFPAAKNIEILKEFISPCISENRIVSFKPYTNLNESQYAAVGAALNDNPLTIIQGPPGTGKTQVVSELCLQLFERNPHIRILICSETHIAVNNVIQRISRISDKIKILRIGDKENSDSIDIYSAENTVKEYLDQISRIDDDDIVKAVNDTFAEFSVEDTGRYKQDVDIALSMSANITGITCNKLGAYLNSNKFSEPWEFYDVVIIDEVCKANLPEILIPLLLSKKAVLVGDPMQLPPVFCSEELNVIKSIEECDLQEYMYIDKLFNEYPGKILLDTQYRMTPKIGSFISEHFYNGQIKNGREDNIKDPMVWVSYNSRSLWPVKSEEKSQHPSIYNLEECEIIAKIIDKIDSTVKKKTTVAVISPYSGQVRNLRKKLNKIYTNTDISIDTVDGFQGKECDIVLFSITRNHGSYRFLSDLRRLNVALSRARDKIIIVSDKKYVQKNSELYNLLSAFKGENYEII